MDLVLIFGVGFGGFFGAVLRFLSSKQIQIWLGSDFPYGTLFVNSVGSFILAFLGKYFLEHLIVPDTLRVGVTVGFLGAFTTFSTFSFETLVLIQDGEISKAVMNVFLNIGICLIFAWVGLQLAKAI